MEQGFQVLLQVFGGLALFLYGTDSLCRAVQQGAGRRLRSLLARCTANPAAGLLTGAAVTAVLQSSSAVTVMVLGFVSLTGMQTDLLPNMNLPYLLVITTYPGASPEQVESDVTQPLAKCVVDAMHDAVTEMGTKEGFHGYGPEQGYPFLKQAIQGYYAGRGTKIAEDEIFISDGAKSDLANVLGLFDVDNTVLVPDPVYPTYVDDNVTDGRKIIYSRTGQENGFLGMPDESVKADIIYICSPNNPTGAAYTRDQLKAWVDYAKKNDAEAKIKALRERMAALK